SDTKVIEAVEVHETRITEAVPIILKSPLKTTGAISVILKRPLTTGLWLGIGFIIAPIVVTIFITLAAIFIAGALSAPVFF
ncbi:hypothetical protein LCGC14_3035980, partial [marine sediment metagenome]